MELAAGDDSPQINTEKTDHANGKEGHWSLLGVQERAGKIMVNMDYEYLNVYT